MFTYKKEGEEEPSSEPSIQLLSDEAAAASHGTNNPRREPTGHFTGRCGRCGSDDLWDDNLHYGCNACGAFLA